jgi:hypothetical protein
MTGGNLNDAISIGKMQLPSFQEAYEMYSQTSRWLSPLVDDAGVIQRDIETGRALTNPLQKGLNIYGVRLPGHEIRQGVQSTTAQQAMAGVSSHEELMQKMGMYDIMPGEEFNVFTLDIETTGLHPLSQTREISLLHRKAITDIHGNTTYTQDIDPLNVTTWNIKTNKMDAGATYETVNGIERPVSLSETAFRQSGARETVDHIDEFGNVQKIDKTIYSFLKQDGPEGAVNTDAETAIREAFEIIMGKGEKANGLKTRFSLHNNSFDIDFMVKNVIGMGNEFQPETISVLKQFAERRANDPHFVVDTLHSVTVSMYQQQAQQRNILERVGGINQEHVNKFLTDSLIDKSLMEKAEFTGQGATASSVENSILNTNLLSLIEEDAIKNPELVKALEKGTHTGKVDVIIQAYIEKAIVEDRFRLQRTLTEDQLVNMVKAEGIDEEIGRQAFKGLDEAGFVRRKVFSAFEKHMRRKASRSSAITLTTNVKDVNLLSESGYKYLADTQEGIRRVSLEVEGGISMTKNAANESIDMLEHLGLSHLGKDFKGNLRYNQHKGNFYVTGLNPSDTTIEGGMLGDEFQQKAQSLIRSTLEKARTGLEEDLIELAPGVDPIRTNTANNMLDIRMSFGEQTELTQMSAARQARNLGSVGFNPNVHQEQLIESLTHTSRNYREEGQVLSKTVHYGDVLEDGTERISHYTQRMQELGLPYAEIAPTARVSSVETSKATADIGATLFRQHAGTLANKEEARTARNISEHINLLEEFGQTYLVGQGKGVQLGVETARSAIDQGVYSRIPMEGVNKPGSNFIIPSNILGKLEVDKIDPLTGEKTGEKILIGSQEYLEQANHTVHYSLPSGKGQEDVVNLRFNHGFSNVESEAIAESEDLVRQTLRHITTDIPITDELGVHPIAQITQSLKESGVNVNSKQVSQMITGGEDLAIPEGAKTAYEGIVKKLGETLRERGIISFTLKEKAGAQLKATLQHTMPEIFFGQNTDVEAMKNPMKITQIFGGDEMLGVAVSPMRNQEGMVGVEALAALDQIGPSVGAERAAQVAGRAADEEAIRGLGATANVLAEDSKLVTALKINKAKEIGNKFEPFAIRAEAMYKANRGKVAIGAAVIGTALIARHFSKKHRENQQYESTMMMSEPEQGQRPYGAQEALLAPKPPQSNSDPLATAGVVGNLDRRKVGHTNMSPQKNAHLFRG